MLISNEFPLFEDWTWLKKELTFLQNSNFFNSKESVVEVDSSPKVASFFAGAGGMDLGLKWAGYNIVYANELDKAASETYDLNSQLKIDNQSILDVDISKIPNHDLLVGGFPCQPFSYAGKRKGLVDDRGMLFFALIEDLYVNQPRFFIFENVKGLLTHHSGQTFNSVKRAIKDAGYRLSYTVLNAEDYLCPQSRQRLFLVGVRSDIEGNFNFPMISLPRIGVKDAIDDLISNKTILNNEHMRHSQRIRDRYKYIPQGGDMRDVPEEHQQRKRGDPSVVSGKQSSQSYHRLVENKPSPTVCAMFQAHFIHYSQDRNLTAREAARLQSFPDDFIFAGKRVNMSWDKDLSQYQQIGNAVPPKMSFSLGRALYDQFFTASTKFSKSNPRTHIS